MDLFGALVQMVSDVFTVVGAVDQTRGVKGHHGASSVILGMRSWRVVRNKGGKPVMVNGRALKTMA